MSKTSYTWKVRYIDPDSGEEAFITGQAANINIAIQKARKKVKEQSKKAKEQDVVEVLGADMVVPIKF